MSASRRCGMTLIEVLATTLLLGLVAALLIGATHRPQSERETLRALAQEVRHLDARARLVARSGEAVQLRLDASGSRLSLFVKGDAAPLAERDLPAEARGLLLRDGVRRDSAITYDPTGASCDYALDLELRGERLRIDFAGLTGWATVREGAP
jgi:prepilin-type N-terminal cleavage/methylation domain-containing protein